MERVPTVLVESLPDPIPEGVTVLDVREPVEWAYGRIDGALHVPLQQLPGRLSEVPSEGQVLVVCKIGGRSARAVAWLQQQGVEAINLDGGMIEWAASGRPMVADAGEPMVV